MRDTVTLREIQNAPLKSVFFFAIRTLVHYYFQLI